MPTGSEGRSEIEVGLYWSIIWGSGDESMT